ncbi:MAG: MiaB/RimO family radical SAM methylthiotransferase [Spirochaetales bacterium]|nr:MiaB/RimO family radical SAM methylthiotransferase [Spirochaetales bacterium]
MNQSDAERIRTVLEEIGYEACETEEEADILGVVACSVRQKAIDKVYSKIHKWNRWKHSRSLLTFVSGCMLPADREKFLKRFDLVFTINELPAVPEMIRQYGVVTPLSAAGVPPAAKRAVEQGSDSTPSAPSPATKRSATRRGERSATPLFTPALPSGPHGVEEDIRDGFWRVRPSYSSAFEAYVPIQNGCDKFCTFCAVPYTRGREVSRPSAEILGEIEDLVRRGYKSVTLLGQNVNSYGLDRRSNEIGFSALLDEIGKLTAGEDVWVYFTSPHPRDMTDDVLETIAEYPTLARQIHLPIQSGDDKVLIRMNRNYRVSGYRRVVERIRTLLPSATLFTDIIVGFTGETEEQFEKTRSAMAEFRYNMAYIAMYSPRPGAASSRWADDIPQDEKKRRLRILSEELHRTALDYNKSMVGTTVRVLVDGYDRRPGYLSAKTEGRIPVRVPDPGTPLLGSFVDVRITDCRPLSIFGEIVHAPEPAGAR